MCVLTPEDEFMSSLSAYFNDKGMTNETNSKKVKGFLSNYKSQIMVNAPIKQITKEIIKEIYVPIPMQSNNHNYTKTKIHCSKTGLTNVAKKICDRWGVDYDEFLNPKHGKSTSLIADLRREFCIEVLATYKNNQQDLKKDRKSVV